MENAGKFKQTDKIIVAIAAMVFISGLYFLTRPDPVQRTKSTEKLGQISAMKNQVRLHPLGSYTWFDLNTWLSEDIFDQDLLFTGDKSSATIHLFSGEVIDLQANSLVTIEKTKDGEIRLNITAGEVKMKSPTEKIDRTFKNPQKISIKNKIVRVIEAPEPNPDPIAETPATAIEEPAVEAPVENPPAAVVEEPVAAPVPVEPPATPRLKPIAVSDVHLERPSAQARLKGATPKLKLRWNAAPNARFYTVEIFQKDASGKLKLQQKGKSHGTHVEIPFSPTGEFKVLISALIASKDRKPAAIERKNMMKDFTSPTLDVYPKPAGLFPRNKQLVVAPKNHGLYFKWQKSNRFTLYALQFSKDKEFKTIDKELSLTTNELKENPELAPGIWHWRVKGLSDTGESPWGPIQEFNLVFQ